MDQAFFEKTEDKIVIIDCGSQFTHLISKKIRDLGVYSEIVSPEVRASSLAGKYKGIVISGGPSSVYAKDAPTVDENIFELGLPVLGICYGHQLMAHLLGGEVTKGTKGEYGKSTLEISGESKLFKDVPEQSTVWMSHFDSVSAISDDFELIAHSTASHFSSVKHKEKPFYSVQFHPEVTHTQYGTQIVNNFLFEICKVEKTWSLDAYFEYIEEQVTEQVGEKNVFVLLSGGVDSMVLFVLLNKILGKDRVQGLHVDTGFMRKNESSDLKDAIEKLGYHNVKVVDASERYFKALEGIVDPEEKRKIIGREFVNVFHDASEDLYLDSHMWLLGQGTIYPDTIESGKTKHADTIKTHHNRVAEIEKMIAEGRVIEPLEKLYKDDVRKLGEKLGLPHEFVWRHPFPGPGLAIMMLCSNGELGNVDVDLSDDEMSVIDEIIGSHDLKYFTLPLKSVGVQGDERTYAQPLVLSGEASYDELEQIATEVPNSLKKINRVIWHVSGYSIGDFELREGYLTRDRADLLREAHEVANTVLRKHDLYDTVWEMPVVLMPVSFHDGESIVLRPLVSENVMTVNFFHMPREILKEMVDGIMEIDGIDAVFLDITNKPPATVQWE